MQISVGLIKFKFLFIYFNLVKIQLGLTYLKKAGKRDIFAWFLLKVLSDATATHIHWLHQQDEASSCQILQYLALLQQSVHTLNTWESIPAQFTRKVCDNGGGKSASTGLVEKEMGPNATGAALMLDILWDPQNK